MAERGSIRFYVNRGGTADELRRFILDLNTAYTALARVEQMNGYTRRGRLYPLELAVFGWLTPRGPRLRQLQLRPDDWLEITRVSFASPGFWETLGNLNPLQQTREYLKDRHERRKDKEWREETERKKAQLENELLEEQIRKEKLSTVREYAETLREFGATPEQIQAHIWSEVGRPLARLARHQDSGLLTDQSEAKSDDQ